jgi:hypothetical protein
MLLCDCDNALKQNLCEITNENSLYEKVLSIVLCAMVLVAMLSSSAFAVVKTVYLDSTQTIAESGLVYGSWKLITASNDKTSTFAVHVLPKYKKAGIWWNGANEKIVLRPGTSIGDTETKRLSDEYYWKLVLNPDGAGKYGCTADGTIRQ